MNLLIPMAGRGSRFVEAGYKEPKPFIEFLGKRMIQHVVDAFPFHAKKIFVMQEDHYREYGEWMLQTFPLSAIVTTDGVTEGAACTCLLAKNLIDNDQPLAILNSDNIIDLGDYHGLASLIAAYQGVIPVFRASGPKWSYARIVSGHVVEVVEKLQVSSDATAGVYFWRKGKNFVRAAEAMIDANFRVNNEFYVAPVYNWNLVENQRIVPWYLPDGAMHGVGTPEDLQEYIKYATNRASR